MILNNSQHEDLSEAVSIKEVKKQLKEYVELAELFKEVVEDNAEYKIALEGKFSPYDEKEREIETLKLKVDELSLREKGLWNKLI